MKDSHLIRQPGDPCAVCTCTGTIQCGVDIRPVEGCSCHISPPCDACVNDPMICDGCGREIEVDD